MSDSFQTLQVLELACAAQRVNKDYIKETEYLFAVDGKAMGMKQPNKFLILFTLGVNKSIDPKDAPPLLKITTEDKELAADIQKYYKRLLFAAVEGDNEFLTNLNSVLGTDEISINKIGFLACLPSVYKRDYARHRMEKLSKTVDASYLAPIGTNLFDLDCEVLGSQRSKNFDAWNIDAIIDNKMVSWMSKVDLLIGPCVVVKAKVKDHAKHWKFENPVTRLNYVKAAQ